MLLHTNSHDGSCFLCLETYVVIRNRSCCVLTAYVPGKEWSEGNEREDGIVAIDPQGTAELLLIAAEEAKAADEANAVVQAGQEAEQVAAVAGIIPVLGCMIVNRPDLLLVMLKKIDHPVQQLVIVHNLDSHSDTNNEVDRILGLLLENPANILGHNHVKGVLTFHHTANLGFRCGCCCNCGLLAVGFFTRHSAEHVCGATVLE